MAEDRSPRPGAAAASRDTRWKEMTLTGWGRTNRASCRAARPERVQDAAAALRTAGPGGILPHGAGRSYGDAALNDGGAALLTTRLDRILAFDEATGELAVEPGVTFRTLLDLFLPRGFLSPVTPGTGFATIGGAVAHDVHGKNHEAVGSFGNHLSWIELLLPSGEIVRTSTAERPELFRLTLGGIGLTGLILAVGLRLLRVPSNAVLLTERRLSDLEALLAALIEARDTQPYSVAWIDALSPGRALGRGVLELATPAPDVLAPHGRREVAVPCDLPGFALNGWTVAAFNELYWRRVPARGRQRRVSYRQFLYPLDAVLEWNRLYGRRGFRQFQCVLPFEAGSRGLRLLLEETGRARRASFLAVLKALGPAGGGLLSFPCPGFTLALDIPERAGTLEFCARLERITRDHGGRVYLAKDSCLSPEGFAEMYPGLDAFRAGLATFDPEARMDSSMARRLRIRAGVPHP